MALAGISRLIHQRVTQYPLKLVERFFSVQYGLLEDAEDLPASSLRDVWLRRPHIPAWVGDILVGLVVIGLLATTAFSAWQFYQGLTTSCIRSRYGDTCLPDDPWGYGFLMLVKALSGLMALGCAAFVTHLRVYERS